MDIINKFKSKGFTILATVFFIAVIVLLNVLVGMLTERFFLKVDLTDTGIYTLSDKAAEFLDGVNETVDIIVLSEESAWMANSTYSIIANVLRNYSAASGGNIRIQYVNPNLNSFNGPKYGNSLSQLKDTYSELEDMARNDIIFLSERRATLISAFDLFSHSRDNFGRSTVSGVRMDQELVSSLVYVLNEGIARITFITNHGEKTKNHISILFERSGYVSSTINLATEDIPEDTMLLVTAAPVYDFLSEEIVKLEQFMLLGGNVMILYDPQMPSLPILENFMAEWGIVIENKLIFDPDYLFSPEFGIIGAHVVSGGLSSTREAELITTSVVPVGVFYARPLTAHGNQSGITLYPLIQTFSSSSYAKDIGEGNITTTEREAGDESGPFVIAYNASRLTRNAQNNHVHANLIVAGAVWFDDSFLGLYGEAFYNNVLMADLANDFNPFGERVFIPVKSLSDSQMLVSATGTRTILVLMVILLPLLIIGVGVIVWRKRRHQ